LTGKDWKMLFSRTELGRETRSLPDITTISIAGSIRCFIWRNASRIFLLAWFRITAFPVFLEAMIPSRLLLRLFVRKNTVQKVAMLCLRPRFITRSNWGLFVRRSLFPNENLLIKLNSQTLASFAPSIGQNSSTANSRTSLTETVCTLSFNIFGLKRHLHGYARSLKQSITYW